MSRIEGKIKDVNNMPYKNPVKKKRIKKKGKSYIGKLIILNLVLIFAFISFKGYCNDINMSNIHLTSEISSIKSENNFITSEIRDIYGMGVVQNKATNDLKMLKATTNEYTLASVDLAKVNRAGIIKKDGNSNWLASLGNSIGKIFE